MSLSPTNLYMNWTGVQAVTEEATPQTIALDGITDLQVDGRSVQQKFYGDNRQFPRYIRNTAKTRKVTIVGGNIAKLLSIPEDIPVTITGILGDVANGAAVGGGGIQVTAQHAKRETSPFSGKNNQYASGSVTFECASDPTTDADPIAITRL